MRGDTRCSPPPSPSPIKREGKSVEFPSFVGVIPVMKNYIEYVFSYGEEEEQEIRDKIGSGIIGVEGFRRNVEKRAIETRRPKIGRHKK